MKSALVHGQLVIVEPAGQDSGVPVIVINIQCDLCGNHALVFAAHHAKAIGRVIRECLDQLPEDIGDEGIPLPPRRGRPEQN